MSCKAKQHFSENLMVEVTQEVVERKMTHITVTQFFVTVSSSSFTCFPAYCIGMWRNESVLVHLQYVCVLKSVVYFIILQLSHSFSYFLSYVIMH